MGTKTSALLREALRLRWSKGVRGDDGIHRHGLYDDRLFVLPWRSGAVVRLKKMLGEILNHRHWRVLANDKIAFGSLIRGLGLPCPELYATYHPVGRFTGAAPCLTSTTELARFLRSAMRYPFFSKPVWGAFGRGACLVVAYDRERDDLLLGDGTRIDPDRFAAGLVAAPHGNHYLFEEALSPHPALEGVYGRGLSTVRLLVVLVAGGPRILSAHWRIPEDGNMTDNFAHGRTGNLIARIDVSSGTVGRALGGVAGRIRAVTVHPRTGRALGGLRLPDWESLVTLCRTAATALPGLRLQHWDVALSARGPVLLEVNALGNMDLRELFFGRLEAVPGGPDLASRAGGPAPHAPLANDTGAVDGAPS